MRVMAQRARPYIWTVVTVTSPIPYASCLWVLGQAGGESGEAAGEAKSEQGGAGILTQRELFLFTCMSLGHWGHRDSSAHHRVSEPE